MLRVFGKFVLNYLKVFGILVCVLFGKFFVNILLKRVFRFEDIFVVWFFCCIDEGFGVVEFCLVVNFCFFFVVMINLNKKLKFKKEMIYFFLIFWL